MHNEGKCHPAAAMKGSRRSVGNVFCDRHVEINSQKIACVKSRAYALPSVRFLIHALLCEPCLCFKDNRRTLRISYLLERGENNTGSLIELFSSPLMETVGSYIHPRKMKVVCEADMWTE